MLYAPAWDTVLPAVREVHAPAWDTVLPAVHEVPCVVCPSMGYSTTSGSWDSLCCMPQHGIQYYQWFVRFIVLYAPAWDTVLPAVREVHCVVCPSMGYSTTSGS